LIYIIICSKIIRNIFHMLTNVAFVHFIEIINAHILYSGKLESYQKHRIYIILRECILNLRLQVPSKIIISETSCGKSATRICFVMFSFVFGRHC